METSLIKKEELYFQSLLLILKQRKQNEAKEQFQESFRKSGFEKLNLKELQKKKRKIKKSMKCMT